MNRQEFQGIVLLLEGHWHHDEPAEEVYALYARELDPYDFDHVVAAVQALARGGQRRMPYAGEIVRKLVELRVDPPTWGAAIKHFLHLKHRLEKWTPPDVCLDGNPECNGEGWATVDSEYATTGRRPCECSPAKIDRARRMSLIASGRHEPCPLDKCDGTGFVRVEEMQPGTESRKCSCWAKVQDSKFVDMHPLLRSYIDLVTWSEVNRMLLGDSTLEAQMRTKYDAHVRDRIEQESLRGLHAPGLARVERANDDGQHELPQRRGELEPVGTSVSTALEPYRR